MIASRRKDITSKLLTDSNDTTSQSSNNKAFDNISDAISDDDSNRQESNNLASIISSLTLEYAQITNYLHNTGITTLTNVTYLSPDPTVGTTHASLPLTKQDIQEMWDGASLTGNNIFFVPTPNMFGGMQSQKLVLDPTSQYDIDTNQKTYTTVDPVMPSKYMSFGADTNDLITGYTELDALKASVWALNAYLSGTSGSNKVTLNSLSFNTNGISAVNINYFNFTAGNIVYFNSSTNYAIGLVVDNITLENLSQSDTATPYSYSAYIPYGNNIRILATTTKSNAAFPIGATVKQTVASSSGIAQTLCTLSVSSLLTLLNTETSLLTNCLRQPADLVASNNNIIATIAAINTWNTNPWNTTYINNLLTNLNNRLNTLIPARSNAIKNSLPSLYTDRADLTQLRLSKNKGTLNNVYRAIQRAKVGVAQSSSSTDSASYYANKFVVQATTQDADNSKNLFIQSATGYLVGDNVYVICDNQNEIYTRIAAIEQIVQQAVGDNRDTVQSQTQLNYHITLADRIPSYFLTSNNLRLVKQLSE